MNSTIDFLKYPLIVFAFLTLISSDLNGQNSNDKIILTETQVLENIYWLRDNPLAPWDSVFIEKFGNILDWIVFKNPDFRFDVKCAKEFLDTYPETSEYRYVRDITLMFTLGQVAYIIENKVNIVNVNSCYFSAFQKT